MHELLKTEKEIDTTDQINAQKKGSLDASYPVFCLGACSLTSSSGAQAIERVEIVL